MSIRKVHKRLMLVLAAGVIAFGFQAGTVSALSGSQFQAGRIMDDAIFFNPATMSVGNIQQFLNAKVPVCDTNHASGDPANQPPFTCLKDFRENNPAKPSEAGLCSGMSAGNRSAAEIIFDVSNSCGVNPQVLIVLLQKEQSLITDTWPWRIQYRSATGYGCPDTAPCDAEYYGFFNQVYAAARQFKRYAKDSQLFNYRAGRNNYIQYNPNAGCGGTNVYIENKTTAGLYNYTPYQPNPSALANLYGSGDGCGAYGNRNFWRLFNDWFGPTYGTVLLKGSGPTIYLRGANPDVAYPIPSGELIKAYGLQNTGVTGVSDGFLSLLNTSSHLTTLFRTATDPNTIYLADNGKSHGIPSGTICTNWSLPCSTASLVSAPPLTVTGPMGYGGTMGNLMFFDGRNFVMEAGKKRPFIDSSDKALSPWAAEQPITITSPLNSGQQGGNALLYANKFFKLMNGTIYYHSSGQYFTFNSFDNFKNWWSGAQVWDDKYSTFNTTPPSATTLLGFASDNSNTYLLNEGSKIIVPSNPTGGATSAVSNPNIASLLSSKTTVDSTAVGKAVRTANGAIFSFESGSIRPIPTLTDFSLQFTPQNIINASNSLLSAYPTGKFLLPNGRVVKPTGGSTIYLYGSDKKLWMFYNLAEVNASLQWANQVLETSVTNIDSSGTADFTGLVKISSAYYVVEADGKIRQVPTAVLNAQRDTYSVPLTAPIVNRMQVDNRSVQFIHTENGAIYYVDGASIRPLASFNTYSSMNGNPNNTLEMSSRAVQAFTIGSIL